MDSEISPEYPDITADSDPDAAALRRSPDPLHRPLPLSKHDSTSRFLIVVLQAFVMAAVLFLFFVFAGVAAFALIHLFVAGRSLRRRRRRLLSPGASKEGTGPGLSQHELRLLPVSRYSGKGRADAADCAVCLEGIGKGDRCRVLPACRHVFHRVCVDKWLVRSPACPVCRTGVRTQ